MAKIKIITYEHDGKVWHYRQFLYNCPGCKMQHAFALKTETDDGVGHTFNMDLDYPTIQPSLLGNWTPDRVCHSHITNGRIKFLSDCWHELAGKEVELPEINT